ncbi:helix-turn-helix domain-containing protein [Pseudomonas capeferrum]|uniref:IclR family transcriptional regulator n=1 Tax=Pseudomonas capeferrum TaxID=1495066 RepID=UPI0015E28A36|nr:IclR family transcriptional regulator C-terminal domain-containing protein [Pseudomonas capeferrum]MBA1203965.1 helix-turn-helix domain-containing protein [Pseudomonas capeferrum]
MSSLNRMLSVLDLFTSDRPVWEADAIVDTLGCSTPTGYRYLKELMQAGLLQRLNGGYYALGPRIALLDYIIRTTDPLLGISIPLMRELVEKTECRCVLSRMDGEFFLDLHHERPERDVQLNYGRGRPRPLFLGGAPKVIIAHYPPKKLRALYDRHIAKIAAAGLGADWESFQQRMQAIRRDGFYLSHGELDAGISALSVPVKFSAKENCAALALVASTSRFELSDRTKLLELMHQTAQRIQSEAAGSGLVL